MVNRASVCTGVKGARAAKRGAVRRFLDCISNWTLALKSDNTKRPCGAYVRMNDATVEDRTFIPSVSDTLDKLNPNHKIFFTADVEAAFNSVRVTEAAQRKLALWMPDGRVFFPFVMLYGAKN